MKPPPQYLANTCDASQTAPQTTSSQFLREIDRLRLEISRLIPRERQAKMGQFFTPASVARLMASMLIADTSEIRLLDAGAGIGSLFAACVATLSERESHPKSIHVTAYESEPQFVASLEKVVDLCRSECSRAEILFTADIRKTDFIQEAVENLCNGLFAPELPTFTTAILNPPYCKIHSESEARHLLRRVGIETGNLYTGFLALAMLLLREGGELIAITPRSFCNGTYFRPFRKLLLNTMELRRIHVFESRDEAFRDDAVLQETVILHAVKGRSRPERIMVTTSAGGENDALLGTEHAYEHVVHSDDPEQFIRVVADGVERRVGEQMARFTATLPTLGLTISTGRVVDFRATAFLRAQPESETCPLLYPANLENGTVRWPVPTRKPQALVVCKETELLLVPNETYVLVKRFSAKEERRRLVASVYEGGQLPGAHLGFENHLNYFHSNGRGLDLPLARGLALYLNSTLADTFFRQFSGHTQLNATDLRNMTYPTKEQLRRLAQAAGDGPHSQDAIDTLIRQEFFKPRPGSGRTGEGGMVAKPFAAQT